MSLWRCPAREHGHIMKHGCINSISKIKRMYFHITDQITPLQAIRVNHVLDIQGTGYKKKIMHSYSSSKTAGTFVLGEWGEIKCSPISSSGQMLFIYKNTIVQENTALWPLDGAVDCTHFLKTSAPSSGQIYNIFPNHLLFHLPNKTYVLAVSLDK